MMTVPIPVDLIFFKGVPSNAYESKTEICILAYMQKSDMGLLSSAYS